MKFELDHLIEEYDHLETLLQDGSIYSDPKRLKETMQKKKTLERTVELYREYKSVNANIDAAKNILSTESDPDMIAMAKEELAGSETRLGPLEEELKIALIPKDKDDDKNIILEVRAGAGGDEAALFARELSNAYMNFAKEEGFTLEVLEENVGGVGGIKEMVVKI